MVTDSNICPLDDTFDGFVWRLTHPLPRNSPDGQVPPKSSSPSQFSVNPSSSLCMTHLSGSWYLFRRWFRSSFRSYLYPVRLDGVSVSCVPSSGILKF